MHNGGGWRFYEGCGVKARSAGIGDSCALTQRGTEDEEEGGDFRGECEVWLEASFMGERHPWDLMIGISWCVLV